MQCSIHDKDFKIFIFGFQNVYLAYMHKNFPGLMKYDLVVLDGKRYIKLTRNGSVVAFIDKTNGDVLKAASWKAPAKGARGNIFAPDNSLSRVTPYGMEYNN